MIRLCICSDGTERAHKDALESENKRFKRISSNGTRLIPSRTINETTDLPKLTRAIELALELCIAWQKTLSFKFRKPNSPDAKTYHVYEFPKFADDKFVIDYAVKTHKFENYSCAYEASLSIYKVIDQCLSKQGLRKRLMLYKDIVGHGAPKLIIVLFKFLHTSNTEDMLCITSLFFNDLEKTMKDSNWNIIDMSVIIMEKLIDLKNAGGNIRFQKNVGSLEMLKFKGLDVDSRWKFYPDFQKYTGLSLFSVLPTCNLFAAEWHVGRQVCPLMLQGKKLGLRTAGRWMTIGFSWRT